MPAIALARAVLRQRVMKAKSKQSLATTTTQLDGADLASIGGAIATTIIPGLWAGPDGAQSCVFGPGVPAASTTFLFQTGPLQTMVRVGGIYR
jgi:hypothetical protein